MDIILDLHDLLTRTISSINPSTISHEPSILYATFAQGLRDCCVGKTPHIPIVHNLLQDTSHHIYDFITISKGAAKILQLCNIFVKDVTDVARYQKNEIIKYVRAQIPLFVSQLRQLLDNTLAVFLHLTSSERFELANFLIPEVRDTCYLVTFPFFNDIVGCSIVVPYRLRLL